MNKQYCSYKRWIELSTSSYENKLLWSEQLILFALKSNKFPSLSLSWGKDSIVMLYMVRKYCKKVKVIFANTGIEYPETYKYRDMMLKDNLIDIDYVETKPIKDFWTCVKEYGYPHYRMTNENDKKKRQPKCCIFLKERPLRNIQKDFGVDLNFIGLMGTESMNRRRLFMRLGGYYFKKSEGINVCLPLMIWTDDDVLRYIKENDIKINPLYSQMNRTGCMFCSGFKNWEKVMVKYNKNIFKGYIRRKSGQTMLPECNV
jgi:3'-phosphoadenosine 5'-phosphosulfate sulfotransferase (PAPS reductase)/FAD synthetase